jgi:hypothetical protein
MRAFYAPPRSHSTGLMINDVRLEKPSYVLTPMRLNATNGRTNAMSGLVQTRCCS